MGTMSEVLAKINSQMHEGRCPQSGCIGECAAMDETMLLGADTMRPLLRRLIPELGVSARERGVAVRLEEPLERAVMVLADATRLRQVLQNLLSNAIKYNREMGAVVLDTSVVDGTRRPSCRISVRMSKACLYSDSKSPMR